MSGVSYGDHGLIVPEAIPGAELDLDAVSTGAATVRSGADSLGTVADDLPSKWQHLSGVYESPESDQVFALMDPVTEDVHTIGGVARKVASALDTYASTAAAPKRELDALRVEAEAFVARVQHGVPRFESAFTPKQPAPVSGSWNGYQAVEQEPESKTVPWYEDVATRSENDELIRRVNEQVALLQAAQAECALAIKKASGASVKQAFEAPSRSDLDARGVDLPWSRVGTAEGKTWAEQFEEGFTDDLLKTLGGLLHLGGWDDSGEWSWGNAGSAWKSMGDGLVAFGMLVDPLAWLDAAADPKGQAGQTLGAVGDGVERWWEDAREHPAVAGGAAASAVGTSFIGPEGWVGRAGRAEELAADLGKAGARDVSRSVEHWGSWSGNAKHVEALQDILHDVRQQWDTDAPHHASPFDDAAFRSMWDEQVEDYQLAHPDFHRDGIESQGFKDAGGIDGHEAEEGEYGPHTRARHLRPGAEGPALDHELSHRGKPPILNSVFTVTEPAADRLIARTLDYNHEAVQRWLQEERDGLLDHKKGRGFNWPAGEIVGRGWSPKQGFFDATSVRVFLKYDPSYPAGYRVQTAYPQF